MGLRDLPVLHQIGLGSRERVRKCQFLFSPKGLSVLAVDGLTENIEKSLYPAILIDVTKMPIRTRVDLVHCQEVVEHIEETYLDNLLASLLNGKFVLMTHALPGQAGHHHVNMQPSEYWIAHLEQRGCYLLGEDTARIRKFAELDNAPYMAKSGMIFFNNSRI